MTIPAQRFLGLSPILMATLHIESTHQPIPPMMIRHGDLKLTALQCLHFQMSVMIEKYINVKPNISKSPDIVE